jgi:four helix bundle protein
MDDKTITSFKDLMPWQMGMELAERVHGATAAFPVEGDEIASRMRDAAITIPAALSEAFALESTGHLIGVVGAIADLETCVELAKRLGFLADDLAEDLAGRVEGIAQSIGAVLEEVDPDLEVEEDYPGKPRPEEAPRDLGPAEDCGCGGHGRRSTRGDHAPRDRHHRHEHREDCCAPPRPRHHDDCCTPHRPRHHDDCCAPPRRHRRHTRDDDCCC